MKRLSFISFAIIFTLVITSGASSQERLKPTPNDRCPVCGMFVIGYPNWLSQIVFDDGSHAFFDGAKDMFKYYLNIKMYNPSKNQSDVKAIYVTDYYTLEAIDARNAYFVIGSDVYGPMGKELIPFKKESDANVFLKDHRAKRILKFSEVNHDIIKELGM